MFGLQARRSRWISPDVCLGLLLVLWSLTEGNGAEDAEWPSHYSKHHQDLHEALRKTSHSHLEEFQIVVPSRIDASLRHVTHRVHHRLRRDVTDDDVIDQELHFKVPGFGHDFQLHVRPNENLVSRDFRVERRKGGKEIDSGADDRRRRDCHYQGVMTSHRHASVALSTCEGLTGLLRIPDDEFILEPVTRDVNHSFPAPQQPHVIYRPRRADKSKRPLHYCGKKRKHPVRIPTSAAEKVLKILSDGRLELQDVTEARDVTPLSRDRRSIAASGGAMSGFVTRRRERPEVKNIETMVVADREMIANHERDRTDITTYVLTIMNMVSGLFADRTLDGQINIVLVGLILLEDNEGLDLSHKADVSLGNFCRWQYSFNHSGGRRPDHSVLLTGVDICASENKCETLGLAQIGGMCSALDSCTINEDMGLGLAFTVAHEAGHSLGMKHDGLGNYCGKGGHIMSPTLNGEKGVFTWSSCSREALRDFFSGSDSMCLDNQPRPKGNLPYPKQLPGELYDATSQCRWQFGGPQRYSFKQDSVCKILWCQREGSSVWKTKYMPAAEGTFCGDQMWCRRGLCVPFGSSGPKAIDGGWGRYGGWSSCSRTCGRGVQYKERRCSNPRPMFGGRHCEGEMKVFQLCNKQDCPPNQPDFRSAQCSAFDDKPYRRRYFTWLPFTKYSSFGRDQCELLCKAEGYDFFDMLSEHVEDGTPCDETSNDVCIQGKCQHVGCDFVLGSNATNDACGVCSGDNSTCNHVTGGFTENIRDSGYYRVVEIPKGARSVQIIENKCCTHSYIAVKSSTRYNYYHLNGNWQVDVYGETTFAGAKWYYDRKAYKSESLTTPGPLKESVVIEILVVDRNPGVTYSYTTDDTRKSPRPQHSYTWDLSFGVCSKSCAGGTRNPLMTCMQDGVTSVDDAMCSGVERPLIVTQHCNTHDCPARWVMSEWSECSRSCGGGSQSRQISCKKNSTLGEVYTQQLDCATARKPERQRECRKGACPPTWHTGVWSKCSKSCGRGHRTRGVYCRSGIKTLRNKACNRRDKPRPRQSCLVAYCQRKYQWFITAWEQCSTTCGAGEQKRELKCSYMGKHGRYRTVGNRKCRRARKPEVSLRKSCSNPECPKHDPEKSKNDVTDVKDDVIRTKAVVVVASKSDDDVTKPRVQTYTTRGARWVVGSWQKCSVTCGSGHQRRAVKCLESGRSSDKCSSFKKPGTKRTCNTHACPKPTPPPGIDCKDNFKWCYLVPQHGQCGHTYFGTQCCQTCSKES